MWTVYFLKSSKREWYYVGSTNDLDRRIIEHQLGKVQSTKHHVPLTLVYTQHCRGEKDARNLERKIKRQRLLKEKIIRTISE